MKRKMLLLILAAMLFGISSAFAQPDLNIVWEKNIWPTEIKFAKFSKDGLWIYCAVNNTIVKMSAATGEFVSTFENTGVTTIYGMEISGNGDFIIANTQENGVFIWDLASEKIVDTIKPDTTETSYISCADISPDASKIAYIHFTYFSNPPKPGFMNIRLYDIKEKKTIKNISINVAINTIKYSNSGTKFATGGSYSYTGPNGPGDIRENDKLELWDAETFKAIATLEDTLGGKGYTTQSIHFSSNDSVLVAIKKSDAKANFFNLSSNKLFFTLKSDRRCGKVRFLPNNQDFLAYLTTWNSDNVLILSNQEQIKDSLRIFAGQLEVSGTTSIWKAFCGGSIARLVSNKITSVGDPKIEPCDFLIFVDTNEVTIELNDYCNASNYLVSIYDTIGNRVFNQEFVPTSNMIEINNTLISGTYIIKLQSGDNSYSRTFQVVR